MVIFLSSPDKVNAVCSHTLLLQIAKSCKNFFTDQEKQFWVNINTKEKATEASKLSSSEHNHKSKQYNQMPTQSQTNKQQKLTQ